MYANQIAKLIVDQTPGDPLPQRRSPRTGFPLPTLGLLMGVLLMGLAASIKAQTASWSTVPLGGGGYVTGLVADSTGNDIYCRTDVGGAFKWNATTDQWDSISDKMVSTNDANGFGLMSVSSLAVDPSNSNKLYLAAGTTYGGLKGIYSSSNKGSTWALINSTISHNGSDGLRSYGERMVVDPNNTNVIWFSSPTTGLYKGTKTSTWIFEPIASASVPFGLSGHGVMFAACDMNGGGPTIVYAGVWDTSGGTGGIYQSLDAGTTWTKVTGATVTTPHAARLASNGTLYVVAGSGGAFKLARGGTLLQMTTLPTGINYHSVTVDQTDPTGNTVFVAEQLGGYFNKIFRSTDGGVTWNTQFQNINGGVTSPPKTEPDGTLSCASSWFSNVSSILVNPVNGNELWTGDFFGVSRTSNAQDLGLGAGGSFWYGLQKGQEETVVLAMKNAPTGVRLMRGQADLNGHYYLDTYTRPSGAAGDALTRPGGGSTPSLDFSESNPDIWARTWLNPFATAGSGAVSSDGGATWMPFGGIDHHVVTNSPTAGTETWDLSAYVANQKAKGATAVTVVLMCADASLNYPPFDSKEGAIPPVLLIDGTTPLGPVADSYVYGGAPTTNNGNSGSLYVSAAYNNPSNSRWTYLRFSLTSVSSVATATLQLNRRASSNTSQYDIGVYACSNLTWVEGDGGTDNSPANEITWNNKPATLASPTNPIKDPNYAGLKGGRVAVSATNPNNMVWLPFVNTSAVRYSKDRGASWTAGSCPATSQMTSAFIPSTTINQLASDRVNGDFYMAQFGSGGNHKIYRSTNGGANWTLTCTITGRWNQQSCQLVCAPGVAGSVWLADGDDGLWRSNDFGVTFTKLGVNHILSAREVSFGKAPGGSAYPYSVYINSSYDNYTSVTHGVYQSDNGGASWTNLGFPTIQKAGVLAGDRQVYGQVFLGTDGRGSFQFGVPPAPVDLVVDNANANNTGGSLSSKTGTWSTSTANLGFYGTDYEHDGNTGQGTKTFTFTPNLPSSGVYSVFIRWTAHVNRATNVPVDIYTSDDIDPVQANQQLNNGEWIPLGSYYCNAGTGQKVVISNAGSNGYVIADAVRFVKP